MLESQNPEVDVLQLKERIAHALSPLSVEGAAFALDLDDSDLQRPPVRPGPPQLPHYAPAELQPAFVPDPDGRYDVHSLLKYHDGMFVQVAYQALLGRQPDPQGFELYLRELHQGRSKVEILATIRNSEEGRAKGAQVKGLKLRAQLARVFRLPVVGKLAQVGMAVAQLPTTQRNQRNFEDRLISILGQVQENARAQSERLRVAIETLGAERAAIYAEIDSLEKRLTRNRTRMELLRGAVNSGRVKVSTLERALKLQERALNDAVKAFKAATAPAKEDHLLDTFYADFEARFRGERDEIKRRQAVYLPFIEQAKAGTPEAPVLDLGCGRGEWLESLAEHKLSAHGADLNHVFIKDNRSRGLEVVEADALTYLRGLEANSIGAITAFHLIEHLPFKALVAMVDEALRVLKPGGVLIFETPNPSNLQVGASNFYLDPTHRNPIPSGLSAALLELRGFTGVTIKELHPYPETARVTGGGEKVDGIINQVLFGPQDYGVIGWKAGS